VPQLFHIPAAYRNDEVLACADGRAVDSVVLQNRKDIPLEEIKAALTLHERFKALDIRGKPHNSFFQVVARNFRRSWRFPVLEPVFEFLMEKLSK
jgi:hypothetical protein